MEPSALPQGRIRVVRKRPRVVFFPLPGNTQGWGHIEAGKEVQVPKEQEAGAAEQDLSSPCSAPHPEPPFPTHESEAPSVQEPLMFFAPSKASLGFTPLFPHWQISPSTGGEGLGGPGWVVPPPKSSLGCCPLILEEHQRLRERGKLLVTHRFQKTH